MKNPFDHLDKTLEHRVRLQIISVLAANDSYDYTALRELLEITDGNLATHLRHLEREKYLVAVKSFIERKPNTRYKITDRGRTALSKHLNAMAELIRQQKR
jgi:DNA-binding HxlR family transcriptional regulator